MIGAAASAASTVLRSASTPRGRGRRPAARRRLAASIDSVSSSSRRTRTPVNPARASARRAEPGEKNRRWVGSSSSHQASPNQSGPSESAVGVTSASVPPGRSSRYAAARPGRRVAQVLEHVHADDQVVAARGRDRLQLAAVEPPAPGHLRVDADLELALVDAGDRPAGVEEPAQQGAGAVPDLEHRAAVRDQGAQPPLGQPQPRRVQARVAAVADVAGAGRAGGQVTLDVAAVRAAEQHPAAVQAPVPHVGAAHLALPRHAADRTGG